MGSVLVIYSFPPIAQDLAYHNFANSCTLCNVPNFMDVMSNIPFVFFGLLGSVYVLKQSKCKGHFKNRIEFWIWLMFFFGAVLIGIGSAYYHLEPNNQTLVWDRLPMTLAFMPLFAAIITERLGPKIGAIFFPLLLLAGISSIFYWTYTESLGEGDLRLYILIQFFPALAIPIMSLLFPPSYTGFKYIGFTLCFYGLAKVFEYFDHTLYNHLNQVISGHTLKHLVASLSILSMMFYVFHRRLKVNSL